MRAVLVASIALFLTTAGCGGSDDPSLQFRIYDPNGRSHIEVTNDDLKRETANAGQASGDSATLYVQLTERGQRRFRALTRSIAREGARRQRLQRFFVAIDGEVVSRVTIDHRDFPDGIDTRQGIEIHGMPLATAVELAHRIQNE